mgnify:CR=1 FL=1
MLVSACSRVSSRTFVARRPAKESPIVAEHARVYAAVPGWRLQHANPSCFKQIPKWNPKMETQHASNPENTSGTLAQHGRPITCHVTFPYQPGNLRDCNNLSILNMRLPRTSYQTALSSILQLILGTCGPRPSWPVQWRLAFRLKWTYRIQNK